MNSFWQGFFSVFGVPMKPIKLPEKPFIDWYHKGPWWEHPFYKKK